MTPEEFMMAFIQVGITKNSTATASAAHTLISNCDSIGLLHKSIALLKERKVAVNDPTSNYVFTRTEARKRMIFLFLNWLDEHLKHIEEVESGLLLPKGLLARYFPTKYAIDLIVPKLAERRFRVRLDIIEVNAVKQLIDFANLMKTETSFYRIQQHTEIFDSHNDPFEIKPT